MAHSHTVNLPREHLAKFPASCVVCQEANPAGHVTVMTGSIGWWTWILGWFGAPVRVKAPACPGCAWKLHALRTVSLLITIAILAAFLIWVWPHYQESFPKPYRRWVMMGMALLCLAPQLIIEVYFAHPFSITAYSESIDYEFTSFDYAVEFTTLNGDANWVKLDGTPMNHLRAVMRATKRRE